MTNLSTREAAQRVLKDWGDMEGVTPGTWQRSGNRRKVLGTEAFAVGPDGDEFIFVLIDMKSRNGHAQAFREAAHIANCSPDRIKAVMDYVKELEEALRNLVGFIPLGLCRCQPTGDGMFECPICRARKTLDSTND